MGICVCLTASVKLKHVCACGDVVLCSTYYHVCNTFVVNVLPCWNVRYIHAMRMPTSVTRNVGERWGEEGLSFSHHSKRDDDTFIKIIIKN